MKEGILGMLQGGAGHGSDKQQSYNKNKGEVVLQMVLQM